MAIDSGCVGAAWRPVEVRCDTRWLMSFAAGLGIADPRHLDTSREGGIVAHPVFTVAPEWALLTTAGNAMPTSMTRDEVARGVHAAHAVVWHRPLAPDETVVLAPTVVGVERSPAGARVTVEIEATGGDGPLWSTRMTNVHLGVEVDGADVPAPARADLTPPTTIEGDGHSAVVPVAATAAHVYTECARIWNPIHTDPVVARRAGLDGILLHGTATLASAVQVVVDGLGAAPTDVVALGGAFRAAVRLPDELTVTWTGPGEDERGRIVTFDVARADGLGVLRSGWLVLR